jgi:para-nitrobenzyl esterase
MSPETAAPSRRYESSMKQSAQPTTANGGPYHLPSRNRLVSAGAFLIRGLVSLAFLAAPTGAQTRQPTGPVVSIDSGKLRGTEAAGAGGADIEVFRGIPYAAPPIAALRWKAPQPVSTWRGVRPAVDFGANCLQKPMAWFKDAAAARYSEDCLYLNVWRPAHAKGLAHGSSGPLPVLVWIYGGAFIGGGTSFPVYGGDAFARQGIVFVSFNYRLGRLGFFAHPALTAEAAGPLGNYAYLDQVAALEWVKRNIAAFGGDPARVTVMGESAGGISVLDLLVSPLAQGLFQQAIVMSGGGRAAMSNRPLGGKAGSEGTAEDVGVAFARSVGIEGTDAQALARLRALPANRLLNGLSPDNLKIDGDIKSSDPAGVGTSVGGPIIDGRIKLSVVDQAIQRGQAARIPVMIGMTSGDLGVPTGQTKDELFAQFGANAQAARRAFDPDGARSADEVREEITRDRLLAEPARFVAQEVAKSGKPAWLYRFSYIPDFRRSQWQGVPHGADVAFFFDTVDAQLGSAVTMNDTEVAEIANAYVGNFVKSGNPNGAGLPAWHEFGAASRAYLNIAAPADTTMMEDSSALKLDLVAASAGAPLIQK